LARVVERRAHAGIHRVTTGFIQPEGRLRARHVDHGAREHRHAVARQAADMVRMKMRQQHRVDLLRMQPCRRQLRRHAAQRCILQIARTRIDQHAMRAILDQECVDVAADDVAKTSALQQGLHGRFATAKHIENRQREMAIAQRRDRRAAKLQAAETRSAL